ncbi:PREDICTED: uncharacterized protein LOC106124676 isoform X2 [Papilio xuthus]|uniref:Uncharacterized protein LOC106124676 isoform X2 n=1 Tax=Papilio xuthus TaxID=66420 RepID=A0AAJ7EGZ9_PAPXU|nr:PREDICTED: uncharacterized protein LOC106124676 isoform X2 [Papilio xuthus]
MSLADVRSARSSPAPDACPECDTSASVTSDLHKYQVACTCKPSNAQYACADDPGPPPPAKTDTPPALPPRPPTSVLAATNRRTNASVGCNGTDNSCRRRKYAWWCVGCGALAAALGGLLAAQHILLRAYTASPQHLETVPAAVPAAMLVLTGVCIMSLARRRNRYSYMIKVVGACCLVCALTCVLVTITTTVIHMNKLQTLKFCEYTKLTRTCTCYSVATDSPHSGTEEDVRCVFEGVSECGVVHGALYWCLRGVFALSVSAVLVCIFSCMLAYQLLSHERKKMYWEQLELRCRSLYRPPTGQATPAAGRPVQNNCSCCAQCHTAQPAWDFSLQHRFWAPGRIGNLYSPNPGAARKTSPWSWFPWPRSNSQNSRCRMGGVPQSGDSAYGFCENDQTPHNQTQPYDERSYPPNFNQPFQRGQNSGNFSQNPANFAQTSGNFSQNPGNFVQNPGNFSQGQGNFGQASGFTQGFQEGFGEASGSFDAQTGVWGPPPPYSPQGRSGSRHHLHHQDPAAATLLHHHHIDVHRNSMPVHEHGNIQPHTCTRSSYLMHTNVQMNPEVTRMNPEISRLNPEISRMNPEISRLNQEMSCMTPEMSHMNQMYPTDPNEIARLQAEMAHLGPERFNTLRGHLVPYRGCSRSLGMSAGNLHRDCRVDDNVAIECLHQKSASKVSDQSSDSCQKQGKENLGFQNDKHSPMRASMQDCRAVNQNAESEVYFADVSSCCNVSVKADCCINPNVSALVGTIENHPESTSESDTGSFTLTRQQRPQPQVGSKRRPRQSDKHMKNQEKIRQDLNSSVRLTEQQIEQLNNSMRMSERMCDRINDPRVSDRMNDSRVSDRMNDSRISDRVNDSRISDRMNDSRISDRVNDARLSDRMNDSRISDRMNDSRISDRMNDARINDRMNDARISDRMNDSRISDRLHDSRISDRMNDSRISEKFNESRISDRMNEVRMSERLNDSRDRLNDSRIERLNDSRIDRVNESRDRLNDPRVDRVDSRDRLNDSRVDRIDSRDRLNDTKIDRINESRIEDRRMSDLNASIRIEGSPKARTHISPLRMPRTSPKNLPKDHPRQSSSDSSKPEFFVPPPPVLSPLSPNTEESLLSDEDDRRKDIVYSNEPETSKCLGPDSQYEPVRDVKEDILKTNHHHCYSDTNTMDSGWQSGSEKQVTD